MNKFYLYVYLNVLKLRILKIKFIILVSPCGQNNEPLGRIIRMGSKDHFALNNPTLGSRR